LRLGVWVWVLGGDRLRRWSGATLGVSCGLHHPPRYDRRLLIWMLILFLALNVGGGAGRRDNGTRVQEQSPL
jgi:hypothetical protein